MRELLAHACRRDVRRERRRRRDVGDAWLKKLDALCHDGPIDLVCFTSDATFSCRAAEVSAGPPDRPEL